MLALLFEVTPHDGAMQEYLDLAAKMKPAMEQSGGCLFIDRFRSLQRPGTLLSVQVWCDEAALARWRVHPDHHKTQTIGRTRLFADYRLRVVELLHAIERGRPDWQAERPGRYNTALPPRHLLIAESRSAASPWADAEVESFASIYRDGEFAFVRSAPADTSAARALLAVDAERVRLGEVERDYGKFERHEAPQFYPPLPATPRA
jgi:heme-degrading monooxygenase HmoA